jgi:hypothetical protein
MKIVLIRACPNGQPYIDNFDNGNLKPRQLLNTKWTGQQRNLKLGKKVAQLGNDSPEN